MSTQPHYQPLHDSMPPSWQDLLNAARTEYDVIATARDFIATFEPQEAARLPEECRPGKFFDATDVIDYAFLLAQHHCGDDKETAALVGRLTRFFSDAAIRVSQILAGSNADSH